MPSASLTLRISDNSFGVPLDDLNWFAAASCLCVADAVADAGVADFVRPTPVVRSDPEQGRLNFHLGIS
ncbi:hypothetical protein Tco_0870326 [Tanacetum coccineum]